MSDFSFFSDDNNVSLDQNDFNKMKSALIDDLSRMKSMSVEEYTFRKKFDEVKMNPSMMGNAFYSKRYIWKPTDILDEKITVSEIENLKPRMMLVEGDEWEKIWLNLRMFCHTMEFSQNPGRFLKFLVIDDVSEKILGVVSIASDAPTLGDRDKYIGWTKENREKDRLLNFSAIGSCIMPTQPFGYNFLGGKLVACLVTSSPVREIWKRNYKNTLVGITTTSLYGSFSMYNNLSRWWHKCGTSSGKIFLNPSWEIYNVWHQWVKKNMKSDYDRAMTQKDGVSGPVTSAKARVIDMVFDACEISKKEYFHGYERGVYYSMLYENGKDFFQKKISEDKLIMKPSIQRDVDEILEWWKPKAIDRYRKLGSSGNLKPDVLYYDILQDLTWEKAKEKFLSNVGR